MTQLPDTHPSQPQHRHRAQRTDWAATSPPPSSIPPVSPPTSASAQSDVPTADPPHWDGYPNAPVFKGGPVPVIPPDDGPGIHRYPPFPPPFDRPAAAIKQAPGSYPLVFQGHPYVYPIQFPQPKHPDNARSGAYIYPPGAPSQGGNAPQDRTRRM